MMKRPVLMVGLLICAVAGQAAAQARLADVQITTRHVSGAVYMLEGRGGNIGVSVGDDGILIVDDQFAPLADKIRGALRELHDGALAFVLNTHHHGDHTGGNAAFAHDAAIIAQTKVRERLSRPRNHKKESLPVITFDESLSLHFNGEEIRMVHFPHGHTDNDSIVIFTKSNVVHMGDLLFTGSFPSFYPNEGGNIEGYAANVGKIIELLKDDTKIIAGHGALATIQDVKVFHAMLVETVDIVRKRKEAGQKLEEAQEGGLPEQYHPWASSFTSIDQWIAKIYRDLP